MKRLLCVLLILTMFLTGCSLGKDQMQDTITFHYLRNHEAEDHYDTFFRSGAIGSEVREAVQHRDDLGYLLALYLQGPLDSNLQMPFPVGSRITKIQQDGSNLTLVMNAAASHRNDIELTIACACLAKTSMELVDVETVTIESRDINDELLFVRSFTSDNLVLEDSYIPSEESTENTQ